MNDYPFDEHFLVKGLKGGNEDKIKDILDSSIRSKVLKIRDFNVAIGIDKIEEIQNELPDTYLINALRERARNSGLIYVLESDLKDRVKKGLESRYETNIARHVDRSINQSLIKGKQDASRFRAIIDAMIDIVEKIEEDGVKAQT